MTTRPLTMTVLTEEIGKDFADIPDCALINPQNWDPATKAYGPNFRFAWDRDEMENFLRSYEPSYKDFRDCYFARLRPRPDSSVNLETLFYWEWVQLQIQRHHLDILNAITSDIVAKRKTLHSSKRGVV
jgi:hypothetical protein